MEVPMIRRNRRAGFALIDPLIGLLAVSSLMVGVINFWRLAEYKCEKARIDARVTQILRESSDYVAYVPYDLLPEDRSQFRSGFLLHPLDPGTGTYNEIYAFSVIVNVTTTNAGTPAEGKAIVLTLIYNTNPEPVSTYSPQETIRTNAVTRVKT
jgi:hypothetical protein